MSTPHRGMALVTVLLVLALATLAATALLSSANISIHRTAALRDSEQAWWVALGVEAWVVGILKEDNKNTYDGLDEPWAQPVDYLPIDQGHVSGRLVDLQGLFNLNDLQRLPAEGTDQAAQRYRAQFERLLASLPDVQVSPEELLGAILDWMDPDQVASFPRGAEDTVYMSLDPPYRSADRPFTAPSELLAIQGMTPKLYEALAPLVTALPATRQAVNVNTAPEMVLRSMSSQIDEMKLQAFLQRRAEKPPQSRAEFDAAFPGMFNAAETPPYDVKTSWFQIRGEVFVGSSRVGLYSLISRANGAPTVLAHSADPE